MLAGNAINEKFSFTDIDLYLDLGNPNAMYVHMYAITYVRMPLLYYACMQLCVHAIVLTHAIDHAYVCTYMAVGFPKVQM